MRILLRQKNINLKPFWVVLGSNWHNLGQPNFSLKRKRAPSFFINDNPLTLSKKQNSNNKNNKNRKSQFPRTLQQMAPRKAQNIAYSNLARVAKNNNFVTCFPTYSFLRRVLPQKPEVISWNDNDTQYLGSIASLTSYSRHKLSASIRLKEEQIRVIFWPCSKNTEVALGSMASTTCKSPELHRNCVL